MIPTTRYHVGSNVPGCEPKWRVECTPNLADALEYLGYDAESMEEYYLDRHAEACGVDKRETRHCGCAFYKASQEAKALVALCTHEAIVPRFMIGEEEFWIRPVDDCGCFCTCDDEQCEPTAIWYEANGKTADPTITYHVEVEGHAGKALYLIDPGKGPVSYFDATNMKEVEEIKKNVKTGFRYDSKRGRVVRNRVAAFVIYTVAPNGERSLGHHWAR
ncbi:hypothetical protein [Streptomyces auratus]|uniref:Uncharacterized protein n=1 Tax=Streptomyces auratus AGR0001 TaxID=1160718 RepID=J1RRJ0_9ACTN|nr:hypothetical protein [Streptomyces auratus]QTZ93678.1 hypothetical protein SU9_021310 [Streptomyces auratus AGR0001]